MKSEEPESLVSKKNQPKILRVSWFHNYLSLILCVSVDDSRSLKDTKGNQDSVVHKLKFIASATPGCYFVFRLESNACNLLLSSRVFHSL